MPLTKRQHELYHEVLRIAHLTGLNFTSVEDWRSTGRARRLRVVIHKMVIAEIVMKYTFIDEVLAEIIASYFFMRSDTKTVSHNTKKFTVFWHRVLDEMYLLKKMELVHAIKPIPKDIRSTIHRLNDIRNAFAHSLFPENRKEHMQGKKVLYRDKDIRAYEGLKLFVDDTAAAYTYLDRRVR